jgi:signal transduction histidine kinase
MTSTAASYPPVASASRGDGRIRAWALGFAVWTLLALLTALQYIIFARTAGRPVDVGSIVVGRLADWYTCAVFTPVYFWMVRRWPLERTRWVPPISTYLGITALTVVAKFALHVPIMNAMRDDPGPRMTLGDALSRGFITENVAFWCLLGIVLAVEYYSRVREQEVHAARLNAQLADARLEALAAQLHPHFLFNTLQGISTLIHRDPSAADTMLAQVSELLRRTLRRERSHEIPLREELELLRLYLGIVEQRFADRLAVTIDVAPDLGDALVPHFILQPIVENALNHGVARRAGAGAVHVAAERLGDDLVIAVMDDGPASLPPDSPAGDGIGLSNTRRRLAQLYGRDQALETGPRAEGGFRVAMRLPWHVSPIIEGVAP